MWVRSEHKSVPQSIVAHPQTTPNCPKHGSAPPESFLSLWHRYSLVGLHTIRHRFIHTKQFIPREPSPLLPLPTHQLKTLGGKEIFF